MRKVVPIRRERGDQLSRERLVDCLEEALLIEPGQLLQIAERDPASNTDAKSSIRIAKSAWPSGGDLAPALALAILLRSSHQAGRDWLGILQQQVQGDLAWLHSCACGRPG